MKKNDDIKKAYSKLIRSYNYQNSSKIIEVFNFWLDQFFHLDSIEKKPNKKILDLNSWYLESNSLISKAANQKKISTVIYQKITGLIYKAYFLFRPNQTFRTPGGGRLLFSFETVLIDGLGQVLRELHLEVNNKFKKRFLIKLQKTLSAKDYNAIRLCLPDQFFLNECNHKFPRSFFGSSLIFFNSHWIKLLFSNRKIDFISIAHGGFYGELNSNRWEEFEIQFSNQFYGWAFNDKNMPQNRFIKKNIRHQKLNRFLYVENLEFINMQKHYFKDLELIQNKANLIKKEIMSTIFKGREILSLSHPKSCQQKKKIFFKNLSDEMISESLLIFDRPGSTLMHEAICSKIRFIYFLDISLLASLTNRYKEFLKILQKYGLLIYVENGIPIHKFDIDSIDHIKFSDCYIELDAFIHDQ